MKDEWKKIEIGFLTLDELVLAHGKIGNVMHANNPYREEQMTEEIGKEFSVWRARLIRLLDNHLIRFPDDATILYVGMQSLETGGVHTAFFGRSA